MLDWSEIWQGLSAAASLGAVVLSLYTLLTARNRKDVADLHDTNRDHEKRLTELESTVEHLPDGDTVHELQLSMVEMKGQLAVIVERVAPIKAIAERLQETFLEHGR
jgi:uncharacterized coiled-coil protein SlyX